MDKDLAITALGRARAGYEAGRVPAAGAARAGRPGGGRYRPSVRRAAKHPCLAHLGILARAGIVRAERHGRSIIYRADLDGLRALTLFLVKDCCAGSPDVCAPLLAELAPCC